MARSNVYSCTSCTTPSAGAVPVNPPLESGSKPVSPWGTSEQGGNFAVPSFSYVLLIYTWPDLVVHFSYHLVSCSLKSYEDVCKIESLRFSQINCAIYFINMNKQNAVVIVVHNLFRIWNCWTSGWVYFSSISFSYNIKTLRDKTTFIAIITFNHELRFYLHKQKHSFIFVYEINICIR